MSEDKNKQINPDRTLEHQVYGAMRFLGWALPRTSEDVKKAEERLALSPIKLPESLKDPNKLLNNQTNSNVDITSEATDSSYDLPNDYSWQENTNCSFVEEAMPALCRNEGEEDSEVDNMVDELEKEALKEIEDEEQEKQPGSDN